MSGRVRVAAIFLALVAVNFIIDVGQAIYAVHAWPGTNFVRRGGFALLESQVLLIGAWLALGDGRWFWRLAVAIPVVINIAAAEGVAWQIDPTGYQYFGTDFYLRGFLHFLWFQAMLFAWLVVLMPVRRLGQWRFTWQTNRIETLLPQFHAGDLFLWLAAIGAALATMRILASFGEELGPNPVYLFLDPMAFAVVTAAAAIVALTPRPRLATSAALIGVVLLIAAVFAVKERYRIAAFKTPLGARLYWQPIEEFSKYMFAIVIVLLNCLVLRAIGCRLVTQRKTAI